MDVAQSLHGKVVVALIKMYLCTLLGEKSLIW